MRLRTYGCLVLALLLTCPLYAGQGKGKGKGQGHKGKTNAKHAHHSSSTAIDIDVALGGYRDVIRDYVHHTPTASLPPGLAKRGGNLPPGLQKQLHRNGTLPPGLQKRLSPYPVGLARRLPYLGDDYEGGFLDGRVVIYNRHTSAILDIFVP